MIGTALRTNPRNDTIEYTRTPSNGGSKATEDNSAQKESIIFRIHPQRESNHLIFQLGTASPKLAVQAAELVAPFVAGIDVNAGCPKPFSTSGGMGAALLSTPDLLCDILKALVEEIGQKYLIGISVKIRLLKTPEMTRALVEKLCDTGITGLTIHCRTKEMRKTEKAVRVQLRMVGEVCQSYGVACLMNGDVESREQAEALVTEFGVDGAMIATAAEKNPSVFRAKVDGGIAPWQETVRMYMEEAIHVENRWGNTKFLLAQMMPGKEQSRIGLSQGKNYEHLCELLDMADLAERARALDAILGITQRESKSEMKARIKNEKKAKVESATAARRNFSNTKRSRSDSAENDLTKRPRGPSSGQEHDVCGSFPPTERTGPAIAT